MYIGTLHFTHTPLSMTNKRSSLLTLDSGQLDSNQSLWCDNGFVQTDLQPCLKAHLDKPHTDTAGENKKSSDKEISAHLSGVVDLAWLHDWHLCCTTT